MPTEYLTNREWLPGELLMDRNVEGPVDFLDMKYQNCFVENLALCCDLKAAVYIYIYIGSKLCWHNISKPTSEPVCGMCLCVCVCMCECVYVCVHVCVCAWYASWKYNDILGMIFQLHLQGSFLTNWKASCECVLILLWWCWFLGAILIAQTYHVVQQGFHWAIWRYRKIYQTKSKAPSTGQLATQVPGILCTEYGGWFSLSRNETSCC